MCNSKVNPPTSVDFEELLSRNANNLRHVKVAHPSRHPISPFNVSIRHNAIQCHSYDNVQSRVSSLASISAKKKSDFMSSFDHQDVSACSGSSKHKSSIARQEEGIDFNHDQESYVMTNCLSPSTNGLNSTSTLSPAVSRGRKSNLSSFQCSHHDLPKDFHKHQNVSSDMSCDDSIFECWSSVKDVSKNVSVGSHRFDAEHMRNRERSNPFCCDENYADSCASADDASSCDSDPLFVPDDEESDIDNSLVRNVDLTNTTMKDLGKIETTAIKLKNAGKEDLSGKYMCIMIFNARYFFTYTFLFLCPLAINNMRTTLSNLYKSDLIYIAKKLNIPSSGVGKQELCGEIVDHYINSNQARQDIDTMICKRTNKLQSRLFGSRSSQSHGTVSSQWSSDSQASCKRTRSGTYPTTTKRSRRTKVMARKDSSLSEVNDEVAYPLNMSRSSSFCSFDEEFGKVDNSGPKYSNVTDPKLLCVDGGSFKDFMGVMKLGKCNRMNCNVFNCLSSYKELTFEMYHLETLLIAERYSPISQYDALFFNRASIHTIIESLSGVEPFEEQVVVSLVQRRKVVPSMVSFDLSDIIGIVAMRRNIVAATYIQPNLSVNYHFCTTVGKFVNLVTKIISEMKCSENDNKRLPITYVSDQVPHFVSKDKSIVVRNHVKAYPSPELDAIVEHGLESCRKGLLSSMKLQRSKRQSATNYDDYDSVFESCDMDRSSGQKNPSLHFGYTMSNPRMYSSSQLTQIGHTMPYIAQTSLKNLSKKALQSYGRMVSLSIKSVSESKSCFHLNEAEPSLFRTHFRKKYKSLFGFDAQEDNDIMQNIRHEANSTYISAFLSGHRDGLDCRSDGMNGAVSCTVCVPTTPENVPDENVMKWLLDNGFDTYFPLTTISYSRKVCHDASKRPNLEADMISKMRGQEKKLFQSMSKALHDTKSRTNYSNTWNNCDGVTFEEISAATELFTACQKKIRRDVKKGNYTSQSVIRKLPRTGQLVLDDIDATSNLREKNSCMFGSPGYFATPDWNRTYTGPYVSIVASYDRMRYISILGDAFGDLHFNFKRLTQMDRLALVCFFSVQCSGPLPVAELVRRIMSDRDHYKRLLKHTFGGDFWSFIIHVSRQSSFKSIGSSKEQRCTPSNRGKVFDFHSYSEAIMKQMKRFYPLDSENETQKKYVQMYSYLCDRNRIKMCGPFGAQLMLQCSAVVGLLPARVGTMAQVIGGGPADVLSLVYDKDLVTQSFEKLYKNFSEIYGPRFTRAYAENTLCEMKRVTKRRSIANDHQTMRFEDYLNPSDNVSKLMSTKTDCIALYSHRGLKNCIQVMFRFVTNNIGSYILEARRFSVDIDTKRVYPERTVQMFSWDDEDYDEYKSMFTY